MTINTDDPNDTRNYETVPLGNDSSPSSDPATEAKDKPPCDTHPFVVQLAKFMALYKYIGVWTYQVDKMNSSIEFRIKLFAYQEENLEQKSRKSPK